MLSLVEDCAAGDVGEGSGHGTSPIRGHKAGYLAQLVQRRQPSQYGLLPHPGDDLLSRHALPKTGAQVGGGVTRVGDGLGQTGSSQPDDADALRPELTRPLPTLSLYGRPGDNRASYGGEGLAVAACDREDYPRSLFNHVPRYRPRGQELVPHSLRDRPGEMVEGHLGQGFTLNIVIQDCVEGDVDASSLLGHGGGVILDGLLVQGIDLRRLGHSASRGNLLGHLIERLTGSTGEKHFSPFAGKCAGHRAADRASPSVDYGVLVLEQHLGTPLLIVRTGLHIKTQR